VNFSCFSFFRNYTGVCYLFRLTNWQIHWQRHHRPDWCNVRGAHPDWCNVHGAARWMHRQLRLKNIFYFLLFKFSFLSNFRMFVLVSCWSVFKSQNNKFTVSMQLLVVLLLVTFIFTLVESICLWICNSFHTFEQYMRKIQI